MRDKGKTPDLLRERGSADDTNRLADNIKTVNGACLNSCKRAADSATSGTQEWGQGLTPVFRKAKRKLRGSFAHHIGTGADWMFRLARPVLSPG
jgi:hypothetical protein